MKTYEQIHAITAIVDKLLLREPPPNEDFLVFGPPFDLSRPNIHESKREFELERDAVSVAIANLEEVLSTFAVSGAQEENDQSRMVHRLSVAMNETAREADWPTTNVAALIQKNIVDCGFFQMSLRSILAFYEYLERRRRELEDQEKSYWNVSHRPPNYYARAIAFRLARLYAEETGKKPTFGIARDGGHPSTDFGRALEQIFHILEINATVRPPAEWAIEQLTEDHLAPKKPRSGYRSFLTVSELTGGSSAAVDLFEKAESHKREGTDS